MNSDISYDPVSVIDEKEAIGETAKIFKDIRETMNIPLITSCLLYTSPSPRD